MLLLLFSCFGLIILALIAVAEGMFASDAKKPAAGIFAAVFLFILSAWVMADSLQIETGTQTTSSFNPITNVTSTNQTAVFADVPTLPVIPLQNALGLPLLLLAIYCLYYYVGEITLRGL